MITKFNESIFARVFRNVLKSKRVKQRDLANALNITAQAISNYANGKAIPTLENLVKIANYLDISVDYLLTGKKNEYRGVRLSLPLEDKAIEILQSLSSNEDLWQKLSPYINDILARPSFYSALCLAIAEFERISEKEGNISSQEISGVWFSAHESIWGFFREFFRDSTNIKKIEISQSLPQALKETQSDSE